jgi:hypothetical protein
MKLMKNLIAVFVAGGAFMGLAHADEPVNLFFSVAHVKPGAGTTTLGIVTVPGGTGSSESYLSRAVPVETKNGGSTTVSSVNVETGFGAVLVVRAVEGAAVVADVTYKVKQDGAMVANASKTVRLEHGQSADLPVNGAEKLVVSFQ